MPDIATQKTKKRYQYCSCTDKTSTCKGTCSCSKRNKSPASTTLEDIMNNVINTSVEKGEALSYLTLEDLVCEAIKIGEHKNAVSPTRHKSPILIAFEDKISNEKCKDLTNWTVEDEEPEASIIGETRNEDNVDEIPIVNRATSSLKSLIDRIKDITVKAFDMISTVGGANSIDDQTRTVTVEATNDAHKHLANEKYVGSYLKNVVRKALHICSKHDKAICTDAGRHIVWRAACIGAKKDQVICASLLNKTVDKAARIGRNNNKSVIKIDKSVDTTVEKVKTICTNAAKFVVSKAIYFGAERVTGICSSVVRDMEEEAVNNCARKHIIWKAALTRPNKSSYIPIRPVYISKEKLEAVDKNIIISDHSLRQLVCVATCISQDPAITGTAKNVVDKTIDSSIQKDMAACLEAVDNATNAAVDICVQTCKGACSNVVKTLADEAVDICAQNECCLEEVAEDQGCTCDESNSAPPEEIKIVICPATGGECPFKPNRKSNILPVDESVEEEESICPCPKKGPKKIVATKIEQKSTVKAPGGIVICPATGGICPFKPNRKPIVDDTEEDTSCNCSESDKIEENSTQSKLNQAPTINDIEEATSCNCSESDKIEENSTQLKRTSTVNDTEEDTSCNCSESDKIEENSTQLNLKQTPTVNEIQEDASCNCSELDKIEENSTQLNLKRTEEDTSCNCSESDQIEENSTQLTPTDNDTEEDISCYCSASDNTEENSTESCESTCPNRTKEQSPKNLNKKINKVKTVRKKDASVGTCPTTGGVCPHINRLRQFKFQSKGDEICPPTCTVRKQPNNEVEKENRVDTSCYCSDTSLNVSRKICEACPEPCGEFCLD